MKSRSKPKGAFNPLLLDSQLCFALYSTSLAMNKVYRKLLRGLDLTYPQYLVMLVLWEWQATPPSLPTVKALGERLALDSGTLTPLLKRLEQLQLVQRQRSGRDEREVHLSLSDSGLALREQVPPLKAALLCDSGIDLDNLDQLRAGLDQLLQQIKALS